MTQFVVSVIVLLVVLHLILISCAYLIFLERKVAAWVQDRIGPNRTNFSFGLDDLWRALRLQWLFRYRHFGLGQALSDGLKLMFKEDYTPPHVDRALFLIAPMLAAAPAMVAWAVIPWGGYLEWGGRIVQVAVAPINIGVIFILAMGSLAVYGVVVAGYASNNKYSFLGGLRATAQMLSYEIPMGLCVLIVILATAGAVRTDFLVNEQVFGGWNLFWHPVLAIIFFTCILAETNRAPFDLAEAEQELVGGYHTEYASMKWALFFLGEYMHMITGCGFFVILFLGGWSVSPLAMWLWPDLALVGGVGLAVLKAAVFIAKIALLLFVMMWIRWTLPRFRFDQLMRLAWRALIPMTLILLLISGTLVFLDLPRWTHLVADLVVLAGAMVVGPLIPGGPPVNRKVALEGSRFSPPVTA